MLRKGKIALLPLVLRTELNLRLSVNVDGAARNQNQNPAVVRPRVT